MRTALFPLVAAVAILVAGTPSCARAADVSLDVEGWTVPPTDPVSAVGHGAILDWQGREVDPSPEFVIQAQRFYLQELYRQANDAQRAEFRAKQHRLHETKALTEHEQVLINSALLAGLIEAIRPPNAAQLGSKNTALRNRLIGDAASDPAISRALLERVSREGLIKPLSATSAGGEAYLAECRNAGVPIPPDWGSPAWKPRGALPFKFIIQGQDAEVFAFESEQPRGVCLALPRSSGNTISALGVICLGTETSRSCFWDNIDKATKTPFPIAKGSSVPLLQFAGGADLLNGNGVCTDCHAGENPFVVHPATPLDMGAKLVPTNWHDPIVHPSWPQNPGPTNLLQTVPLGAGDGSCLTCHGAGGGRRFPEVSTELPGYCGIILPSAMNATMPPGDVGNPKYDKHTTALKDACRRPPQKPIQVVINGATQSTPGSSRVDIGGELGPCSGGDCPLGFCYWRTLHGPFWQRTDSSIPIADPAYRGSFVRIYAEAGAWKWRAFSDPAGRPRHRPEAPRNARSTTRSPTFRIRRAASTTSTRSSTRTGRGSPTASTRRRWA